MGNRTIEKIVSGHKSCSLFEGVRFGKREVNAILANAAKFNMGVEYEMEPPIQYGDSMESLIDETTWWIDQNNIPYIDKVEPEHDEMVEVITDIMDIETGINHIKRFLELATDEGFEFPGYAGMHVSISMKETNYNINRAKLLVLMAGDYLEGIFPSRAHTDNIEKLIREEIESSFNKDDSFDVGAVESIINNSDMLNDKYVGVNIGDYFDLNGRVELRFVGGGAYNKRFEEIRWQVLRAVFLLGIAYDEDMYKKEYHKALYRLWTDTFDTSIELKKWLKDEKRVSTGILSPIETMTKEEIIDITAYIESIYTSLSEDSARNVVVSYLRFIPPKYKALAKRIFRLYIDTYEPARLDRFREWFSHKFSFIDDISKKYYLENVKKHGLTAHDPNLIIEIGSIPEVEDYILNEMDTEDAVEFVLHYAHSLYSSNNGIVEDLVIPVLNKDPLSFLSYLSNNVVKVFTRTPSGVAMFRDILESDSTRDNIKKIIVSVVSRVKEATASVIEFDIEKYRSLFNTAKYLEMYNDVLLFELVAFSDHPDEIESIIYTAADTIEEIIDNGNELHSATKIILREYSHLLKEKIQQHISET